MAAWRGHAREGRAELGIGGAEASEWLIQPSHVALEMSRLLGRAMSWIDPVDDGLRTLAQVEPKMSGKRASELRFVVTGVNASVGFPGVVRRPGVVLACPP